MKPYGNKCIVLVEKEYKKEKGKPVLAEDGTPIYDLAQVGKVLVSNIDGIKKGSKVITNYRGGMPVQKLENKNSLTVIFEADDIYAIE
jgi:hypothetical protein